MRSLFQYPFYYAQLIAKYLKDFENLGLPDVDVDILNPWFL